MLAPANVRFAVSLPWAAVPMAVYLWAYWRFIQRTDLRANGLRAGVWAPALAAGLPGFGALLAFVTLMARLVSLPASELAALTVAAYTSVRRMTRASERV